MELHASGFNAWGQLLFEKPSTYARNDDGDLDQFFCVLKGSDIGPVQPFLSHTTVTCDATIRHAGHIPREHSRLCKENQQAYSTLAETSNGTVAILRPSGAVCQFSSIQEILSGARGQTVPHLPACTQVVAYNTGFAALASGGAVYTWGDERYGACLGRDVSVHNPAEQPGLVAHLKDLPTGPIAKLAAGGYVLAALTTGNDLYVWGGGPGGRTVPASLTSEPTPIAIDEQDIADVAVGEAHLVVLTTEGEVFVTGENRNGQLGLPLTFLESWSQPELNLQEGERPVAVATGPRTSFILIKVA